MNRRSTALATVSLAVLALVAGCGGAAADEPDRDESGAVTKATDAADIFSLRVGDCIPDAVSVGTLTSAAVVPCGEPHKGEVFAALTATGPDTFPGSDEMVKQSQACNAKFKTFIGMSYDDSKLEMTFIHPADESWVRGDREILCIVEDPAGPVTGTLKGVAR